MSNGGVSVFFEERKVGALIERDSGLISFKYSESWLSGGGFAVSASLPFNEKTYDREAQNFFGNLLPEGDVRSEVASRLGISRENDFRLLEAIGGECAGALTIGHAPLALQSDYEKLDVRDIGNRIKLGEVILSSFQRMTDDDASSDVRLSLAGAQDKLPVFVKDGELFLAKGNSPTTHILKLPNDRFPHLAQNETLVNHFAKAMGLEVPETKIVALGDVTACLVERYDRVTADGVLKRLHQEDFCQALGFSFRAKYENEGGPSFSSCYECLADTSSHLPEDLERLVSWQIFSVLIGNCDAHAKNISLLRHESGEWVLSQFYDLVSTRLYSGLSKNLAMGVGGARDSGTVTGTHWANFGGEIRFGVPLLRSMVKEAADTANDRLAAVINAFGSEYGPSPIFEQLRKVVYEQSRRLNSQLLK
jgi:serine/threonine-protein kinase HipA